MNKSADIHVVGLRVRAPGTIQRRGEEEKLDTWAFLQVSQMNWSTSYLKLSAMNVSAGARVMVPTRLA
jgi:hypothetical protein